MINAQSLGNAFAVSRVRLHEVPYLPDLDVLRYPLHGTDDVVDEMLLRIIIHQAVKVTSLGVIVVAFMMVMVSLGRTKVSY